MKSLLSRFRRLALPLKWLVAPVAASLKMIISRMDFLGNCSVRQSPFDSLWGQGKVSLQRASAGCTRFKHSPMALPTVHAIPLRILCRLTREGAALGEHSLLVATVQAPWKACRRNACASVRLQVNACQLRQGKT